MSAKTLKLKTQYRSVEIDRKQIKEETRTLTVSFSSEQPAERWYGNEILSHENGAVDLSRIDGKGAVLREHDTGQQVGVVEKAWIEAGKGYAQLRFSKSPLGEQEFQDMKDGIRTLVSTGYRIKKIELLSEADNIKTYRATKWQPLEISTVSVPADPTVGFGRSEEKETETQIDMRILHDPAATEGGGGKPAVIPPDGNADYQRNVEGILALAETYKVPMADAQRFIKEKKTADDFQGFILQTRYNAKPTGQLNPDLGLSDQEIKQYSLVRAINCLANNRPLDGIEKEASDAVAKAIRKSPQGFFVPNDISSRAFNRSMDLNPAQAASVLAGLTNLLSQRALNVTTLTAGGYTVATDTLGSSMIELLRNNMVVSSLGARTLSGLVGDVAIPKHTGGATAYWLSETAAVTESQQTFGQLLLTPHRLAAATAYTKQLLAQSSIDVEAFVRQDLMEVLARAKDLAAINGSGVLGQPLGILNTTGVGSITYGAATTWAKVVENETTLFTANVTGGPAAFVSSFATQGKWKTAPKVSAQAIFLIENGSANGYRFAATTQMPSGDKTIFGVWSDLIIADWNGIDIVVDPYSLSLNNQVRIVVNLMTDLGVRHPVSFVVSTDSGAQ